MESPKKPKYRKQQKLVRHLKGVETRGCELVFGDYGLRVLDPGWITARQLEAARKTISRFVKRAGKLWINVFPDKPISKKPAETRMGSGKGAPEYWVAQVRPGRIVFEMTGIPLEMAREALRLAGDKLPLRTELVVRSASLL